LPLYEYQCECGVRFEKSCAKDQRTSPKECPSCKEKAPWIPSMEVASTFNTKVTGPVPQNTGASEIDHEVDRVVGQHAKEGWAAIDERKAHKEQLAEEAGVDTGSLSKLPDGDYMVLPEFERKVLEGVNSKLAEANNEVIKTLREKRALEGPPPSDG